MQKNEYKVSLQCKNQTLAFDGKTVLNITVETPVITPEDKRTAKLNKFYAALSESFCDWAGKAYYSFVCDDYASDGDRRKRFRYHAAEAKMTYETNVPENSKNGDLPTVVRYVVLTCRGGVLGESRTEEKINPSKGMIKHLDFNKKK